MSIRLGAHWLAFLWNLSPGEGNKLQEAVRKAKASGATVFEIMPPLLNAMPASETAQALKDGGITDAVMCNFYPPGSGLGDPLAEGAEFDLAVAKFKEVIAYMLELRTHGISIDLIVGPSCFLLGYDYELPLNDLNRRVGKFYAELTDDLRAAKIKVAIELLREVEDKVVASVENLLTILVSLPADVYGAHVDTFHLRNRKYDIFWAINRLGKRIFHFHANGLDRVPPGHESDDIVWDGESGVVAALKSVGYGDNEEIATNEPFCDDVRAAEPSLREGLPPAMPEPEGLQMTNDNLTALGLFN